MCTGYALAGGKAGSMMLTTYFHLVQRLIMREARTFRVITPPQEGFRLDVRLVSLSYNKSLNRAAAALLPGKYLNGGFHTGERVAGDLTAGNKEYMARNEDFHTVDGLVSRRQNYRRPLLSLEVRDAYGIQQNLAVLRELSEGRQSPW
jgi:hypothetical protein